MTDDIFVSGNDDTRKMFISRLSKVYELISVLHMPGHFQLFGLHIEQDTKFEIWMSAEETLKSITTCALPTNRRNCIDDNLNSL